MVTNTRPPRTEGPATSRVTARRVGNSGRETKSPCALSVAHPWRAVKPYRGRSLAYASWYRAGRTLETLRKDVYVHPVQGKAIEFEHAHLVAYDGRPVEWFHDLEDFFQLADDIAVNPGLLLALPYDVHEAFIRTEEELEMDREQDRIADLGKDLAHVAHTEVF